MKILVRTAAMLVGLAACVLAGCRAANEASEAADMSTIEFLSPDGLHRNPAFSQVVTVDGPHRVVYVGGQNAVDANGGLVGAGDIAAQAVQVAHNIEVALEAAGARLEHVVEWTIYVVQGQNLGGAFGVFQQAWGQSPNPPTICVVQVAGLAHPHFLLEIRGMAVVPLEE